MGMPAAIEAWRAGFWPWAAVSTWPRMTSVTSSPRDLGALQRGPDGDLAQLVGGNGCEGPAEGPHRRAGGGNDDDVFHGEPSVDGLVVIAARKMPRTRALVNCGKNHAVFQ